jgi:hypothetical protein
LTNVGFWCRERPVAELLAVLPAVMSQLVVS